MKICVTSTGDNLDSSLDPRFGRCAYFVIVDTDTMQFEVVPNVSSNARGGAGVEAAQTVISKGVDILITGDLGPNSSRVLSTSNIKVITGAFGTIREVIEKYKSGDLR